MDYLCKNNLMDKKAIVLHDIKNQLMNQLGSDLVDVFLFGSQAKNKETPDSDYDILILLKTKKDWRTKEAIIDICYDIDLKYDILIDPHILSEEELLTPRGKQPVFINAMQNGLRV